MANEIFDPEKRVVSFKVVLEALLNEARPFPPSYLHSFSDLNQRDLLTLKQIWPGVPSTRRQAILEDLEELADADTLVSFEEVGRMALKDENPKARAVAIRLLWDAEDKKLVPVFIEMLKKDPDMEVRATAATALGVYIYMGEIEEIPGSVLATIEEGLLSVMNGQDAPLVRRRALESLGFSSRPEVPELIRQAYGIDQFEWKESALYAMGRSADKNWENIILSEIDNSRESIRAEAIRAAGELELTSARQPLIEILEEEPENDDIWAAIIWSLSQIGGEGVRPTLEKLLDDTDDPDETDFIEEALDNLSFTEDMGLFDLLEVDPDEAETHIIDVDGHLVNGDLPDDQAQKPKKPKKPR